MRISVSSKQIFIVCWKLFALGKAHWRYFKTQHVCWRDLQWTFSHN